MKNHRIVDHAGLCAARRKRLFPALGTSLVIVSIFLLSSCASTIRAYEHQDEPYVPAAFLQQNNIPRFDSTVPVLYFSSSAWMPRALTLIESARESILITIFLGNYCDYTAPIYEALIKKAQAGVKVHIIIDSSSYEQYDYAQKNLMPMAIKRLKNSGVHVAEYNPISGERIFMLPGLLDREHRKFWIVDGFRVAMGGMNINYLSFAPYDKDGQIDTFLEVESIGAARYLTDSFCETWNANSPTRISPADFASAAPEAEPRREVPVWIADQGLKDRGVVDKMFDLFFTCAQKELWVVQGLAYTTGPLIEKIRHATSRGVSVNILASENSDRMGNEIAAKYCFLDMIDAGASVYMYNSPERGFLHYKLMMADRSLTAFGGVNFNFRSQHLSRELAFIYDDDEIGAIAYENLEALLKNSRKIERAEALTYRSLSNSLLHAILLLGG